MSPALEGRLLTTGPPGNSLIIITITIFFLNIKQSPIMSLNHLCDPAGFLTSELNNPLSHVQCRFGR